MARSGTPSATPARLLLLLLAIILSECVAQELEILPSQKHQKIAVHKSAVLTCQPKVVEANLVSDLQWKDPRGYVINPALPGPRPEMYTEAMPGKQSLLLYISSITPSMAGNYTCQASYAASEQLSASVLITTFVAITWKNAPENQYATKGKDFKVMCEVTAEPAPTVDWFKDGTPLVNGDRHVIHRNGLQINNVEESDDGTYVCRAVVIETGELAERNIKLEVYTAPEMSTPVDETIKIRKGESASVSCKALGKPPPTYMWIKDSTKENLGNPGSRFSVNEHEGTLRINQVEASDYGKYVCSAVNKAGQNEIQYNIEVIVPPTVERLENVTFSAQKEDARLICHATGRPAPEIIFRKLSSEVPFVLGAQPDDDRITLESINRLEGDQYRTTGTITITNLNRTDDGLYECIAKNEGGEARRNGHIQVKFKPSFEHMPTEPVWSWGGRAANLSCLAESIPNATIKWRFHERELVETNHIKIYGSSPFSYITITATDDSLFGFYKCIATNSEGEAEHTIQFLRAFPPGPIQQVKQDAITATSVRFAIEPPAELMGPRILAIIVQYKEADNLDFTFSKNRTWSVPSPYVVEGLSSLTTYDFRFAAINQVGQGIWSAPTRITMLRRSAPEQPKWRGIISPGSLMHGTFSDRFELKWMIPADNGEPIDGYKVTYCPVRKVNGEWQLYSEAECKQLELTSIQVISYEVRPLRADTHYKISLQAHNRLGFSAPAELYIQTALGMDTPGFHQHSVLSSSAIVGVVVGGVLLCLLLIDCILYCTRRQGVIATICGKRTKKHDDDEAKLGSNKSPAALVTPPSPAPLPPPVKLVSTPTYVPTTPVDEKEPLKENLEDTMKRNTSVEYDGHKVYTTGGTIIGKNSAV